MMENDSSNKTGTDNSSSSKTRFGTPSSDHFYVIGVCEASLIGQGFENELICWQNQRICKADDGKTGNDVDSVFKNGKQVG